MAVNTYAIFLFMLFPGSGHCDGWTSWNYYLREAKTLPEQYIEKTLSLISVTQCAIFASRRKSHFSTRKMEQGIDCHLPSPSFHLSTTDFEDAGEDHEAYVLKELVAEDGKIDQGTTESPTPVTGGGNCHSSGEPCQPNDKFPYADDCTKYLWCVHGVLQSNDCGPGTQYFTANSACQGAVPENTCPCN